jgi:RNA polymerase sigma factor (TIGR02999 family)
VVFSLEEVSGVSDIPGEINELLTKLETGDKEALRLLFPLIYKDSRRLAQYRMRKQRPDHTLQPTALVHEAYMRLENRRPAHFRNRNHFVAVCALLMRQILVQYERARLAEKRGGGAEKVWFSLTPI